MDYTTPIIAGTDGAFLDVPFDTHAAANKLMCGWVPDDLDLARGTLDWAQAGMPIIERSRWPDLIQQIDAIGGWLERLIMKIKNQGREPSCVYNAGGQGTEIRWNWQFGLANWVELSAISGYRWNGSLWSGSSVAGCANWLEGTGLLPVNSERNLQLVKQGLIQATHPATGYGASFADNWKATAKFFRVHEWIRLTSVEQWFSALFRGFPCIGGRNGHCICHVRPMMRNGKFVSCYANSWGDWGESLEIGTGMSKGFGFDSEGLVDVMTSRGAWAIRTVRVAPWVVPKDMAQGAPADERFALAL